MELSLDYAFVTYEFLLINNLIAKIIKMTLLIKTYSFNLELGERLRKVEPFPRNKLVLVLYGKICYNVNFLHVFQLNCKWFYAHMLRKLQIP
jgi:hypothetical protein